LKTVFFLHKLTHHFCDGLIITFNKPFIELFSLSQRFPADQRNGDGEAKCPAGRARVCPTVLHAAEPGARLPAQVRPEPAPGVRGHRSALKLTLYYYSIFPLLRFYGKNSSYVHGGLDNNGKPVEAVYGQSVSEADKKPLATPLSTECPLEEP